MHLVKAGRVADVAGAVAVLLSLVFWPPPPPRAPELIALTLKAQRELVAELGAAAVERAEREHQRRANTRRLALAACLICALLGVAVGLMLGAVI